MHNEKRMPVMEDYLDFQYLGDPHSLGGKIVWTHSWWDMEQKPGFRRYREEVLLAGIDSSGIHDEQVLSAGGQTENFPVLDQNGNVYFLSDASRKCALPEDGTVPKYIENELFMQNQIYRWKDGRAEKLTEMLHGVESFYLSPDGSMILFTAWKYAGDSENALFHERTEEERAALLEDKLSRPFVTEKQSFKSDAEMGYRSDRSLQLFMWEEGKVRLLLKEGESFSAPCWLDEETILFQRAGEDEKITFWTMKLDGEPVLLAKASNVMEAFEEHAPMIDRKNNQILFGAVLPDAAYADPRGLYAVPLSGGEGSARRLLSPEKDIDGVFPQDMNFLSRGYQEEEYVLMPDGRVYYVTGIEGDVAIASVKADGEDEAPVRLTKKGENFHALSMFDAGHILALCGPTDRMPEIALVDIRTGETTLLTESNPQLSKIALQKPESIWTPSGTHGFYLPPMGNKGPAPVILFCHGGPTSFYCSAMNYELQALAGAGFGVLYANPRGCTGYGRARNKDEMAYDGSALEDVIEFVETVCADHPELDRNRVGICGGSYGGYLTLYALENSDRFKAGCAHRPLSNMQMISYSSHSAGGHTREEFPVFLDRVKADLDKSPASFADRIKNPLLILESDCDANCVPEQMDQVFSSIKAWNPEVPCEYIRYPDSCHGLNFRGPMELSVHHRNANLNWFKKWL